MKAIALVSGGLDSALAAKLIEEQGIELKRLHFIIPFCHRTKKNDSNVASPALKTIHLDQDYLEIIRNPRY